MELTDRLGTLPRNAQIKVIERVFQKLLMAFGNQMAAKWNGLNMTEIYEEWADTLKPMSLGAVNHAIELAKAEQHPPSLGEFTIYCRKYVPPTPMMLEKKFEISKEKAAENIAKMKEMIKNSRIGNAD